MVALTWQHTDNPAALLDALVGADRNSPAAVLEPTSPVPLEFGEEATAAYRATWTAYYEYRQQGYRHRQDVYEWQLLSSRVTFVVVLALVAVGVRFSWQQLKKDLRDPSQAAAPATEIEASTKGLKLASPVLGVVILALSLGFFYLYLVYVYPIADSI